MHVLLLGLAEAVARNGPRLDRVVGNFFACTASRVGGSLHAYDGGANFCVEVLINNNT